jgi:hypothetical protein
MTTWRQRRTFWEILTSRNLTFANPEHSAMFFHPNLSLSIMAKLLPVLLLFAFDSRAQGLPSTSPHKKDGAPENTCNYAACSAFFRTHHD